MRLNFFTLHIKKTVFVFIFVLNTMPTVDVKLKPRAVMHQVFSLTNFLFYWGGGGGGCHISLN